MRPAESNPSHTLDFYPNSTANSPAQLNTQHLNPYGRRPQRSKPCNADANSELLLAKAIGSRRLTAA